MTSARSLKVLAILACLVATAATTLATDYFVAPAGDDANAGTIEKPLKTPDVAAKKLMPGDTLHFRAGRYLCERNGVVGLAPWRDGEAGKPITFAAYKDEKVTIDCGRSEWGFTSNGYSYIVIDGFEITARNHYGMKISAGHGGGKIGHHVTVRNCEVHHTPGECVFSADTEYLTIENCWFHDSERSHGLYLGGGCNHATIRHCLSERNEGNSGMQLNAAGKGNRGSLVENCVLRNNAQGLSLMANIGNTFRNNLTFNNGVAGPRGSGNREVILWTYDVGGQVIPCKDNTFDHNTIVNLRNLHLFHIQANTTGTVIKGNVLYTGKNVLLTVDANSMAGLAIEDNGVWNTGPAQVAIQGEGKGPCSLADLASRFKVKVGGNVFADPLFVNLAGGDLRLSPKGPRAKAGVDWSKLPIAPGGRVGPRWRATNAETQPAKS